MRGLGLKEHRELERSTDTLLAFLSGVVCLLTGSACWSLERKNRRVKSMGSAGDVGRGKGRLQQVSCCRDRDETKIMGWEESTVS